MWSALRSDLTEFVSTVRDESQTVLDTIDSKLAADEGNNGEDADGAGDAPSVVVGADGDVTYVDKPAGFEATGLVLSAADEVSRLRGAEETYSAPLLPDEGANEEGTGSSNGEDSPLDDSEVERMKQFLAEFDVSSETENIAAVLEAYPDTVKVHFEKLVPTAVTYEHFWQRYYYRCDEGRVQRIWDENESKARVARQEALSEGIQSVKSIFGGAVKALGVGGGQAAPAPTSAGGSSTYEKYQADIDEQRKSGAAAAEGGLGAALFGASGRPPFVMNTAVSDVDDSMEDGEEEEEEEEEELGWSDDDDDEEEEGETGEEVTDGEIESVEESGADSSEEQIDFTSPDKDAVVGLKKQVAQAEEERDQLHETVAMQAKETAHLREEKQAGASPDSQSPSDEIQNLKMQLFEKDSEIAALKASLEDFHHEGIGANKESNEKVAALDSDLTKMTSALRAKDDEIRQLKETSAKFQEAANQTKEKLSLSEEALQGANSIVSQLRSELKNAKSAAANRSREVADLRLSLEESSSSNHAVKEKLASAQEEISKLRSELIVSKEKEEAANIQSNKLELKLAEVKAEMEERGTIFSKASAEETAKVCVQPTATPPPTGVVNERVSPSSSPSSAVKVPNPPQQPVSIPDDDDDDWGDSWGDEDD